MSFVSDQLRAFVAGQREAAARARAVRTTEGPPPPDEALRRAMELWELDPSGFERPRTDAERRGIEQVREAWRKLREAGWGDD